MIPISLPVICDLTFDPMRELLYLLWQHVMIIDYWLYFVPLLSSHALLLLLFPVISASSVWLRGRSLRSSLSPSF